MHIGADGLEVAVLRDGALIAGGVTYAAIPSSTTGQITACYGLDKVLKVVDSTCPAGTTKLTWQSKGTRFVGVWSSTKSYQPNDIVTSGGSPPMSRP